MHLLFRVSRLCFRIKMIKRRKVFSAVFNIHIMNRVLVTKKRELGMVRLGYTGIKLIFIGLSVVFSQAFILEAKYLLFQSKMDKK